MESKIKEPLSAQVEYRATPQQMQEFSKSNIWKDMCGYLSEVITIYQLALERAQTIEDIREIQGRVSEIRMLMELPDVLFMDMEDQYKQKENRDGRN